MSVSGAVFGREMAGIGLAVDEALCERERRRRVSVEWMGSK